MERKQIQFTRQEMSAIRREARRRRVSESAVVREAVDAWLRAHDPAWMRLHGSDARGELWSRALSVVGRFSSGGGRNIAVEHDRELGEVLGEDLRRDR